MDDLLSLASAETGGLSPHPQDVDLHHHVRELLADLGWADQVELREEAPSPRCWFDPTHLGQIVTNLVSNAQRYGRPPVVVTIGTSDGSTTLSVSDGGAGVPAGQVDVLFQRFHRSGRAQAAAGGSGFGLYMSARLAAVNEAELVYEPGPPHRFELRMPESQEQGPLSPRSEAQRR